MNNLYKVISTLLMIALILVLVWIFVNYYKETPTVSPSIVNPSPNIVTIPENNGEDDTPLFQSEKEDAGKDIDVEQGNEIINEEVDVPNEGKKDPIIITSSEQTSNKEKQEVLTEIDKTLMELLKVVDKVQTVDETRLGIDESEVQP